MDQQTLPARGEMVTVTYLDDSGTTRQFHGRVGETLKALTHGDHRGQWRHHWHKSGPAARRWVAVLHPIEYQQVAWKMERRGRDFEYDNEALVVCLEAEHVTIAPITDEGRAYLRAHETAAETRTRLIARFAELDPEAATELDAAITMMIEDAVDDERAAANAKDD